MKNRYVVTELKTGKFQPPHAGKLNFYIALVDDALRRDHHNGTYTSSIASAAAASIYNKIPTAEQKHLGKRPSPTIFYDDHGEPILDYTNDPGNTFHKAVMMGLAGVNAGLKLHQEQPPVCRFE